MKNEAHRALFSALQVRSLWGPQLRLDERFHTQFACDFFFPDGSRQLFPLMQSKHSNLALCQPEQFFLSDGPMGRTPPARPQLTALWVACSGLDTVPLSKNQNDENQQHKFTLFLSQDLCLSHIILSFLSLLLSLMYGLFLIYIRLNVHLINLTPLSSYLFCLCYPRYIRQLVCSGLYRTWLAGLRCVI